MKKAALTILLAFIIILSACGDGGSAVQSGAEKTESAQPEQTKEAAYEFEFEDTNGKVHKLSDYRGKPVYLEVWASWCGVCVSSLPEMDEFAGEDNDFAVLSVVTPNISGEMSKEEFIEWYNGLGHKNLTVLLDEKIQILTDFGISAFPTQLMFDAQGNFVTGFVGLLPKDTITQIMGQIAQGTYNG